MIIDLFAAETLLRARTASVCSDIRARRSRRSGLRWTEPGVGRSAGRGGREDALSPLPHESLQVLGQVDRLASLGSLSAGVGHELANVVCILLHAIEMTREAAARQEPVDPEDLEGLDYACRHITAHARSLVRLGSPGQSGPAVVDVAEAVDGTLQALRLAGRLKHADVQVLLPEGRVLAALPQMHMEQVLMNLLVNAFDALREARTPSARIRVVVTASETGVTCTVEDNGPGMSPETADRCFETYYTTKPQGSGTGLGLPLVRQMVEAVGGRVTLWTRPGDGARITVNLPAAPGQRAR